MTFARTSTLALLMAAGLWAGPVLTQATASETAQRQHFLQGQHKVTVQDPAYRVIRETAFAALLTANPGPVNPDAYSLSIACLATSLTAIWPNETCQYLDCFEITPRPAP